MLLQRTVGEYLPVRCPEVRDLANLADASAPEIWGRTEDGS